jgi:dipeptidyl aminopeptidase/acylaminoacyl peptidase
MNPDTATAGAGAEAATGAAAARRPMTEDDLLDLVWVADPQISPDGARVAFTRVHVDRAEDGYATAIWIADAAGGGARPLTSGPRDGQPRWSPDGRRLAFTRAAEKGKPAQLFVLPMDGGEATPLTKLEKGAGSPAWSPDGRRIAFLSATNPALDDPKQEKPKNEPGRIVTKPVFRENDSGFIDWDHRDHVWVVEAAGGEPRQLTTGRFAEGAPRWSRDGRAIRFVSDRRDEPWFGLEESRLWEVAPDLEAPTDGAALTKLAEYRGPVVAFVEASDGRIATIGAELPDEPHAYDQWDVLLHSGARPMTKPRVANANRDYAFGEGVNSDQHPPRGGGETPFAFAADGRAILAAGAREGSSMLLRVDLADGSIHELTPRHHDLIAGTVSADGRRWALTLGGLDRPGDLYRLDVATGTLERLYAPNAALFECLALGEVEEFRCRSFDGATIHGWIVKPPGFDPARKYPLVLQIHGGPHTAYGHGFFHEFHQLAGAGYVVLFTNPRGSTSYGWEFAHAIQYRYPGDDAKDLLCAVDEVVGRGYVDGKRIGVTGGSGGGLLTNWLIAQSDRFAAAVTQRCVSEWASMMQSCDFAMFLPFWFRSQPWQDPKEYAERSPFTYVERITTPLLILHSEEDWRTPIAQGEFLFRALKQMKRPVAMVRFPGESHELSRSGAPSRRVQNQQHIRRWFDRWLMGREAPEYGV